MGSWRISASSCPFSLISICPKATDGKAHNHQSAQLIYHENEFMRRNLEIVALAALAVLIFTTARALYGPVRLPQQIPTHFAADGRADAWGPPQSLLALPIFALLLYTLMTVVARFPSAFNFPARVTPANREALEAISINMIAWLKVEVLCLFCWVQHMTIQAARSGQGSISPVFMPLTLGVVFATILWHFVAMRRAAKPASAR